MTKLDQVPMAGKRATRFGALAFSVLVHACLLFVIGGIVIISRVITKPPFEGGSTESQEVPDQEDSQPPSDNVQPTPDEAATEPTAASTAPDSASPDVLSADIMDPVQNFSVPSAVSMGSATLPGMQTGSTDTQKGSSSRAPGTFKMNSPFGNEGAIKEGLVGTFIDLKQDSKRKPTNVDYAKYDQIIADFVNHGWDPQVLEPYYKARKPMTAFQFYIPPADAGLAPKFFGVEKEVQATMWLVHYKGSVVAPKSGKFRFVGGADDVIVVRFNDKTVFDGSIAPVKGLPRESFYGFVLASEWFRMRSGEVYPMEVLIGEKPGGVFNAALLIEEEGKKYEPDPARNAPLVEVFQTAPLQLPKSAENWIPIAKTAFTCAPVDNR